MITRADIEERVREWGLSEDVVEKDYVIGWLLWGIGSSTNLGATWVFKGGTCLKKCFIETYRFSEDLDFTVLPGGPIQEQAVAPLLEDVLNRVYEASGLNFTDRKPYLRSHPSGNYTEDRIYYRGPRNAPTVARVKLDLSGQPAFVVTRSRKCSPRKFVQWAKEAGLAIYTT
jgi:predicted nucleotidyltransferase component of viral defense system